MDKNTIQSSEEVDLKDLFSYFERGFYKIAAFKVKAFRLVLKLWWLFLLVILAGAALGYFTKVKEPYKATLVLQTNYMSQPFVYNAMSQINDKLAQNDQAFLDRVGLGSVTVISSFEITPVIDVVSLLEEIQSNDRTLSAVIKELEVEDDTELFASQRFYSNYKYHNLTVYLTSPDAEEAIKKVIAYVNELPYAKELASKGLINYKDRIAQNEKTIVQIDDVIKTYTAVSELTTGKTPAFFNNDTNLDLRNVLDFKAELVEETEALKNGLVALNDVTVILSDIQTTPDTRLSKRTEILYPMLFGLLFLFGIAWYMVYTSIHKKLKEQNLI